MKTEWKPTHEARRAYHLRTRYGITLAQYETMLVDQGGVCALCLLPPSRNMASTAVREPKLVVDHNHVTGKVRALLCFECNTKLHSIEDEQFMLAGRRYLHQHDGYEFTSECEK